MQDASIQYCHFRTELPDDVLSRLGSRYQSRKDAGSQLRGFVLGHAGEPRNAGCLTLPAGQLTCANEVFPEAALADPVADLEVWQEWRSGLRQFPYPGVYARLDIWHQEMKMAATSSIGVLGEIVTGLLSQSVVAPFVVVRPVRRWPDFIYLAHESSEYAFVESKASASFAESEADGLRSVPKALLADGLADAVQELNAEPHIAVWLYFTDIVGVQPLRVSVTVLEVVADPARKAERRQRVPDAIIAGLTERAMCATVAEFAPELERLAATRPWEPERSEKWEELWSRIREAASNRIPDLVDATVPTALRSDARRLIGEGVTRVRMKSIDAVTGDGRRLALAKQTAARGEFAPLRQVAEQGRSLFLADMPPADIERTRSAWKPDWARAGAPLRRQHGVDIWRCSSAALAIGPAELDGKSVDGEEARSEGPDGHAPKNEPEPSSADN